jgi:hypothetical protein
MEILPDAVAETVSAHPYLTGLIAGIVLTWLGILFVYLCCRTRCCRMIEISSEAGSITINSEAICNVLKKTSGVLAALDITRIRILQNADGYDIIIRAVLDPDKGNVPELMQKMTAVVREKMTSVFGITDIRQVKLTIVSCGSRDEESDNSDDDISFQPGFQDAVNKYPAHNRTITLKSTVVPEVPEKKL